MDRGGANGIAAGFTGNSIPPKPYNIQDSFDAVGIARPPAGSAFFLVYIVRGRGVPAGHLIMPALRKGT